MSQDPPVSSAIEGPALQRSDMTEVERLPVVPQQPFGYQGPRLPLPTLLPPIRNPHGLPWHRSSPRLAALQPPPAPSLPRSSPVEDTNSPVYTNRSPPAAQWTDRIGFRRSETQHRSYVNSPQSAVRPNIERLALAQPAHSDSDSSRGTNPYLSASNFAGASGFRSPWVTPPSVHEYSHSRLRHQSPPPTSFRELRPGSRPLAPGLPQPVGYSSSPQVPANPAQAASTQQTPHGFRLRIRQQPEAARACGFGERDRRVVDPPPILQLELSSPGPGQPVTPVRNMTVDVVHASLWNARGTSNVTNLSLPNHRSSRRLMGTLVASSATAIDERNAEGVFFAFPDLSCRSQGRYRLRFSLMRIDPTGSPEGAMSQVVAHVMSDVFTVYSAKDFPGMKPSTSLTLALKQQGVAIQAKQGRYGASSKRGRDEEEEEEEAEDDDTGFAARKRPKSEKR